MGLGLDLPPLAGSEATQGAVAATSITAARPPEPDAGGRLASGVAGTAPARAMPREPLMVLCPLGATPTPVLGAGAPLVFLKGRSEAQKPWTWGVTPASATSQPSSCSRDVAVCPGWRNVLGQPARLGAGWRGWGTGSQGGRLEQTLQAPQFPGPHNPQLAPLLTTGSTDLGGSPCTGYPVRCLSFSALLGLWLQLPCEGKFWRMSEDSASWVLGALTTMRCSL